MNDPLYEMTPDDPLWWRTIADESDDLNIAILQGDDERRDRKVQELTTALLRMDVIPEEVASERTVWIAVVDDYDSPGVAAIGATREAVITAVKAMYPEPYAVEWSLVEGADKVERLHGDFEQVIGYSVKHGADWAIYEQEVVE